MKGVLCVLILLLVTLSGCGGQTAAPQTEPTTAPTADQAIPTAETEDRAGGPAFQVDITGDYPLTITPENGTVKLFYTDFGGSFYYLQFGDEYGVPILLIAFFGDNAQAALPKAGTFTLAPAKLGELLSGNAISASATIVSDEELPEGGRAVYTFDQPGGTITIETDGDSFSGSFSFTMQGRATAATEYNKRITVNGTFSGVTPDADG